VLRPLASMVKLSAGGAPTPSLKRSSDRDWHERVIVERRCAALVCAMTDIDISHTHANVRASDGVRAAEELLIDIIDAVREPLLVLDGDLRVTHANRSFFRAFRVDARDTIGKVLFSIGDGQWDIPPLRALLRGLVCELLGTDVGPEPQVIDVDVDHVFPRIGRRTMLLNATLVSRGPEESRIILLAIEDVTERRATERCLAEQRQELERSNAALEEFASVASHDLQEPLRKILAFGERLETSARPALEGEPRRYLDGILGAAARMRALVSDLLTYSLLTTRGQPFVATSLAALVYDVIADLETLIADTGGRVEVGALPVIDADPAQMRQLLQNLVANAIKYRRKDRAPVIRFDSSTPDAEHCTISVADNGVGFKQEYSERIFKMFERLHGRAHYDGSGIGLAICRRVAERHGGTITAASRPGEGTTFSITLPLHQAAPRSSS
jgi:signal transduction histidine kinase